MPDHNAPFEIGIVDMSNAQEIDQYLAQVGTSLFYASPAFSGLVGDHLECETGWLIARQGDEIKGILPFAKGEGKYGPVYNSMAYYGSNGGVIQTVPNTDIKKALIDKFYDLAIKDSAVSATIISNPLEEDSEFYETATAYDFKDERIGQITHFPTGFSTDDLIKIFDDPRPRNIRRAEKEGIVIERSNDQTSFDFLFSTHKENMQAIGGFAKDESFFKSVMNLVPEDMRAIYVAKIGETPVAALLLFYHGKTVEYFTPTIIEAYRGTQALALAIYKAMQDAMNAGYKNWNWGGTWITQGGVYDFKKRWGTSEYRYFYYTRLFKPEILNQTKKEILDNYKGFFVVPFQSLAEVSGS